MAIAVEARRSGFISRIHFADGCVVKKGDLLGEFEDINERLAAAQIDILRKTVELTAARLSQAQVNKLRAILAAKQESANAVLRYRVSNLRYTRAMFEAGAAISNDKLFAMVALKAALLQKRTVNLEEANFESAVSAWSEQLNSLELFLRVQTAILQRNQEKLKIVASADGELFWYVFERGFVEVGSPVAVIR